MTASEQSQLDIERLKDSIRAAVARREAEGKTKFVKASAELFDLLSSQLADSASLSLTEHVRELQPLRLQPEFIPSPDDHYHLGDLLKYHDEQFIWNAYRAILKREPDEPGLNSYLATLRSGRFNKIDVLASLRFSPEGRRNHVTVDGLKYRAMVRLVHRLPVAGYLAELATAIIRLPHFIRQQRALETHLIAQQERTAAHFNDSYHTVAAAVARLNESISQLIADQKDFARVQHQQMWALFASRQSSEKSSTNGHHELAEAREIDSVLAAFHDRFRGDFKAVTESLEVYLPLLAVEKIEDSILDLGCGRGEWLQLLHEQGRHARGVESNTILVEQAQAHALDVVKSDALAYLRGLPDHTLKAVTAFHFVEHLELDELLDLLAEIRRVLKPGGLLIIETPNPKNLVVGACNFYSDPTHLRPLFPETLEFFVQQLGFARPRLQYLHPSEDSPFTGADDSSRALNTWLFGPRDYAVIAYNT